ncbi:hypothetical protein FKV91_08675 [Clostridium acetobutylicum]|nr:hypothetical protein DK921_12420 [Clostridium acetobutylicum]PSM05476.1 hypothetical protein C7T89_12420 [Clostridium sp. NJ4]TQD48579.1 hypothetical protein FKV91_08675 [Clostridium acetobutylicum]
MPSASGSHYQAHSGLSPPSCRPCWAHKNEGSPSQSGDPSFLIIYILHDMALILLHQLIL